MTSGCGGGGSGGSSGGGGGGGGNTGPCGACKYLRRKCVEGCIFAPYFDAEQGAAHFAAVHRVFGASNASKLLLRIPPQRRFDAVVTLCYEALARVRDPVYGCVSHIFFLQNQVVNLQAEVAHIQARLSTLQRVPDHLQPPPHVSSEPPPHSHAVPTSISSSSTSTTTASAPYDPAVQPLMTTPMTAPSTTFCCNLTDQVGAVGSLMEPPLLDDGDGCCDLHAISSELVYKYFSGAKFCSSD